VGWHMGEEDVTATAGREQKVAKGAKRREWAADDADDADGKDECRGRTRRAKEEGNDADRRAVVLPHGAWQQGIKRLRSP
jgi:hypothetical protein